jgi:periplasmic protein CpxP/Spy
MNRAVPLLMTTMLIAAPAWAQSTATQPPAATEAAPQSPAGTVHKATPSGRQTTARQGETMQNVVEQRINELHARLHITTEQSQQWDQFAQTMRDNAKDLDQRYRDRAQNLGSMSAVDAMKSFADIEQVRAQDMEKLVPAFQTLYASLSDQQKKSADQLFRNYAAKAQARRQSATTR